MFQNHRVHFLPKHGIGLSLRNNMSRNDLGTSNAHCYWLGFFIFLFFVFYLFGFLLEAWLLFPCLFGDIYVKKKKEEGGWERKKKNTS